MAIDIQKVSQASLMKATDAQVKKISAKCTELQNKEQEVSNLKILIKQKTGEMTSARSNAAQAKAKQKKTKNIKKTKKK